MAGLTITDPAPTRTADPSRRSRSRPIRGASRAAEAARSSPEIFALPSEYFLALIDLARAGTPKLKAHLHARLARIKGEHENLAKRFNAPDLRQLEDAGLHYSSWKFAATYVLLSIPGQTPAAIARKLSISEAATSRALAGLERIGVARRSGSSWSLTGRDIHVAKDSPWNAVNHQLWRSQAVTDASGGGASSTHYTAVFSISRADLEILRQMMFEMIDKSRKVIAPSKEEVGATLCCDLFVLGEEPTD